jgi:predicted kinase
MATLHLLYGFTGAGKTTYAKQLEHEISAIRFTPDEWMIKLYGQNPPVEDFDDHLKRIIDLIWQLAAQIIHFGQDVILDFGFWSRASRDEAREKAQVMKAEVKLYYISTPEQLMKERVLQRSDVLPESALMIDDYAFELFKSRFEKLAQDESHIVVSASD